MKHPQIIITFSPTGQLQAEIPGPNGSRQVIPLPADQSPSYKTLCRLLNGEAMAAASEAWAIMQAHKNHKSYEDQLDNLADQKYKAAKERYRLVESQTGVLPQIKTTKSGKPKTVQSFNDPSIARAFQSLL